MKSPRAHRIFAIFGAVLVGLPGTLFFGWFALMVPVFNLDMLFRPDIPLLHALLLLGASVAGFVGIVSYWASLASFRNGSVSSRSRTIVLCGLGAGILAAAFVVVAAGFHIGMSLIILALVVVAVHAGVVVWKLPLERTAT